MPYGVVAEDLKKTEVLKAKKMRQNPKMSNGMVAEDLRTTLKAQKVKENPKMSNGMVAEDLITTEDLRTVKIIRRQTESAKNPATEDLRPMKIIHRQTKRKKKTTATATEDLRPMKIIHRKTKRKKKTTNHEFNCDVVCLAKRLGHLHLA